MTMTRSFQFFGKGFFALWLLLSFLILLAAIKVAAEFEWDTGRVRVAVAAESTSTGCSGTATYQYEANNPANSHQHQEPFNFDSPCDDLGSLMDLLDQWGFRLLLAGAAGLLSTVLFRLYMMYRRGLISDPEDE